MNSSDINNNIYDKGKKISDDLINVIKGLEKGEDSLNYLMNHRESSEEFIRLISDGEQLAAQVEELHLMDSSSEVIRLSLRLRAMRNRRRRLFVVKVSTVAAVVMAISFSIFKYTQQSLLLVEMTPQIEVITPTLILPNSQKLDLVSESQKVNDNGFDIKDQVISLIGSTKMEQFESTEPVAENGVIVESFIELILPSKFSYTVVLADGSEVILNANSRLRYPEKFIKNKREVYLEGEAYFKVSKSSQPFIVHVDNVAVQVYGTQFNINNYNKELLKTTLVEGSVGIHFEGGDEVRMQPNQLFVLNKTYKKYVLTDVKVSNEVNWILGKFSCDEKLLSELLTDIASWYGVSFSSKDKDLQTTRVSVSMNRGIVLENVIDILQSITDFKFINEGGGRYTIE